MMTASVAMGVAVDDTIHFLTWFRGGVLQGKTRREAIMLAYDRCAGAMTQTTPDRRPGFKRIRFQYLYSDAAIRCHDADLAGRCTGW